MRLAQGHDRGHHAGAQPRGQTRVGQHVDRRQPGHPAIAGLRAPRRRRRAHDAAAGGRRSLPCPGRRTHRRQGHRQASAVGAADQLRQDRCRRGQGHAARSEVDQAQGSEGLEDCRQAAAPARHRGEAERQQGLRHRPQIARHAQRRDQGLPGVRRQAQELRRSQGRRPPGREEGRAREGLRRRRGRRHLVAGEDGARCVADRLGRRPQRLGVQRQHCRISQGGTERRADQRRHQARRCAGRHRRRREEGRGDLFDAVPVARLHGGDERDREAVRRQGRVLGADAESRSLAGGAVGGIRHPAQQVRGLSLRPRRRLRPARRHPGLHPPRRRSWRRSFPACR